MPGLFNIDYFYKGKMPWMTAEKYSIKKLLTTMQEFTIL